MITRRGGYDADVVVVGAGPAGLAAAIRLRWLKGYDPIVSSTVLVDPESPGGLSAMGGCVFTGPSWATNVEGVVGPLVRDMERLRIPQIRCRARDVEVVEGGLLETHLDDGRSLRSHAVILATGFRALHGESRWYGRGLHITYKGYGFFDSLLGHAASDASGSGLAIIGHEATLDLMPLIAKHAAAAGGVTLLLQGDGCAHQSLPQGIQVRWGRTLGYLGDAHLQGVRFHAADGDAEEQVPVGAVLVDYHAFERSPEQWLGAGTGRPTRDVRSFVNVDARMTTSVPGIYAAGDITGRYASTVMAMGDGICAAFSAHEYVFQRKFGCAPSLFAYAATGPVPTLETDGQRFPLPATAVLVPLGALDAAVAALAGGDDSALASELQAGEVTVAGLAHRFALSREESDDRIFAAMHARALTLHRVGEV